MRAVKGGLEGTLRAAGGVLLAIGAVVVFARRSSHQPWSDFELLLTLALPAALLFALAVLGRAELAGRRAEPWRAVLLVTSVALAPLALFQLLHWAGASTAHLLLDAAVMAATAAVAMLGARRAAAPYAVLLAGFALLGTWMLVWLKVFPHASADTVRVLILTGGAALMLAAGAMSLAGALGADELATAGAVGLVLAGVQGVILGAVEVTLRGVSGLFEVSGAGAGAPGFFPHLPGLQTSGWDVYLLAVSAALVASAAWTRKRGPGYVGALGLLAFLVSVAVQLTKVEHGRAASSSLLGWPLILLVLGLAGLAAPLLPRRRRA